VVRRQGRCGPLRPLCLPAGWLASGQPRLLAARHRHCGGRLGEL